MQQGSLQRREQDGSPSARFVLTDGRGRVTVAYVGILPDLFREGQGIVALGSLDRDGVFQASEVLAKHDENYMPKEVVAALKKAGEWNPASGAPPPPAAKLERPLHREGRRMSSVSAPELGHFALALAVAFAFAQAILPLWGAHRRDARLIAAAPSIALGTFFCLGVSSSA